MKAASTALVAGATGLVGGELVRELLERPEYVKVTVLVRRPLGLAHPKLEQRVVNFDRLEEQADAFAVDHVFCCLGTTIGKAGSQAAFRKVDYEYPVAMGRLAKQQGAKAFLLVSSMGADVRSTFFYNRVKGEVEGALAGMGLPTLLVFRPSLLLGQREEPRFGENVAAVVMKAVAPLMVGGMRKYRAIRGRTVARAMVNSAQRGLSGAHTYESDQVEALGQ